jgi:hypothetical protein
MSEDDDVIGGEIETPIAFVISGLSEEGTSGGPGCQFIRCLGRKVGISGATKHLQVLIGWGDTVESDIRGGFMDRLARKTVQQIRGSVEPIYPIMKWERSIKEQGANHIIYGAKSTLSFTILR